MSVRRSIAAAFDLLVESVLRRPATTSVAARQACAAGGPAGSPELDELLDKVRHRAYRVTDADIARLAAAGVDEETIFELTCAAAVGVSQRRLEAALAAIDAEDAHAAA